MSIEPFLTFKDLEEIYGYTRSWVKKAMKVWGLPSYKLGGKRRFLKSEIDRWTRERREVS